MSQPLLIEGTGRFQPAEQLTQKYQLIRPHLLNSPGLGFLEEGIPGPELFAQPHRWRHLCNQLADRLAQDRVFLPVASPNIGYFLFGDIAGPIHSLSRSTFTILWAARPSHSLGICPCLP